MYKRKHRCKYQCFYSTVWSEIGRSCWYLARERWWRYLILQEPTGFIKAYSVLNVLFESICLIIGTHFAYLSKISNKYKVKMSALGCDKQWKLSLMFCLCGLWSSLCQNMNQRLNGTCLISAAGCFPLKPLVLLKI